MDFPLKLPFRILAAMMRCSFQTKRSENEACWVAESTGMLPTYTAVFQRRCSAACTAEVDALSETSQELPGPPKWQK